MLSRIVMDEVEGDTFDFVIAKPKGEKKNQNTKAMTMVRERACFRWSV